MPVAACASLSDWESNGMQLYRYGHCHATGSTGNCFHDNLDREQHSNAGLKPSNDFFPLFFLSFPIKDSFQICYRGRKAEFATKLFLLSVACLLFNFLCLGN